MVEKLRFLDRYHLQKYIFLISSFVNHEIDASVLEDIFLKARRSDDYWGSGSFCEPVERILNEFFLDVDEYAPKDLFDPNYQFNINDAELRSRASIVLSKLEKLSSGVG
jgi:Bacterial self-protective colicin-like immunity